MSEAISFHSLLATAASAVYRPPPSSAKESDLCDDQTEILTALFCLRQCDEVLSRKLDIPRRQISENNFKAKTPAAPKSKLQLIWALSLWLLTFIFDVFVVLLDLRHQAKLRERETMTPFYN
jgi:hypothetical protein